MTTTLNQLDRDRAACQVVNPDRSACIERIYREHAEAVLRDIAALSLDPWDIANLQHIFRQLCPEIVWRVSEAIDEHALLHGSEVLYSLTYTELSEQVGGVAQHRDSMIATLLTKEKRGAEDGDDAVRVQRLDRALRMFA